MHMLRTIALILTFIAIVVFAIYNWKPVEVTLWENLVMETKLPVLVVMAFLSGLLPAWAYHLSVKWGLRRRVRSLEQSLKTAALTRQNELRAQAVATGQSGDPPAEMPVHSPVDRPGMPRGEPLAPDADESSGATS